MIGGTLATKPKQRPPTVGRMLAFVRETEKQSHSGGTGFTILKMRPSPIRRLLEDKSIGSEEFEATKEIELAFFSMSGALLIKPISMEKQDRSHSDNEPDRIVEAQRRYKLWANHWTKLAKRGDPTLQIVVAVVIDERPFYLIEDDVGLRHGMARRITIDGLRDYAGRMADDARRRRRARI